MPNIQYVHPEMYKNHSATFQARGKAMEHTLGVTEARRRLSELIDRARYQGDTVTLLKYGKPAAVLVPIELYERWKAKHGGEIATSEHTW
jgi:prevent-host-death family protein